MDQIHISLELIILGSGAANLSEFLRAFLLRIDDYPRLAAVWKYTPVLFGILGVCFFPSIVPNVSTLVLLAHGAASPSVWYAAYPMLKPLLVKGTAAALHLPTPTDAPAALPADAEREKP